MNVLDSEIAASGLMRAGLEPTSDRREADVILFNTCSIRQHAEDKVYSALGRLKHWKTARPHGVLGVLGCMAQKDQDLIFRRAPHVDLVLGPGQFDLLPEVVHRMLEQKTQQQDSGQELHVSLKRLVNPPSDVGEFSAFRSTTHGRSETTSLSSHGTHHVRLRQILLVLHRAVRARPGAKSSAR